MNIYIYNMYDILKFIGHSTRKNGIITNFLVEKPKIFLISYILYISGWCDQVYTTNKYLLLQAWANLLTEMLKVYTTNKYLLVQASQRQITILIKVYATHKYLLLQAEKQWAIMKYMVYATHKYLLVQANVLRGYAAAVVYTTYKYLLVQAWLNLQRQNMEYIPSINTCQCRLKFEVKWELVRQ